MKKMDLNSSSATRLVTFLGTRILIPPPPPASTMRAGYFFLAPPSPPAAPMRAGYFSPAPPSPPAISAAHLSSRGLILIVFGSTVATALIAFAIWWIFLRKMTPTEQRTSREDEEEEENQCPYCLENMRSEESLEVLPCGHTLHAACADAWVRPMNTCPVCRCTVNSSGDTS